MKYIFITGGVVSGLGKGICAASLGRLLKQRGLRVQNQKFDPYLNVDPGTMSPYQHGEVFVTDDGAETDLDLGHYERFTDENLTAGCSVSAGKVYWSVLCREREGGYLGRTVQIIPHITDEIKSRIYQMDNGKSDVLITEIGGTVGDIESQPFLEAIRQVAAEQGKKNVLFIHVPMIVEIPGSGELKSKPTQHSVKELLSIGIQPDILVCRTNQPMTEEICRKIALFCNMEPDCVIPNTTASTLYEVPLLLEHEGLANVVCRKLELSCGAPDLTAWTEMVARIKTANRHVTIALVGKYTELHDAYLSVEESLFHAGTANHVIVDINWVDSSKLTQENAESVLGGCAGILVPGGFGDRGIEGMIVAAQYARTHKIPYFGICLGMQLLFEKSYEYGEHTGLGLIPGEVCPLADDLKDPSLKVPHIGWNRLDIVPGRENDPLFKYTKPGEYVYYVHSFYAKNCAANTLAASEYSIPVTGAVKNGLVYGTQFHPEKSGDTGLRMLRAFAEL